MQVKDFNDFYYQPFFEGFEVNNTDKVIFKLTTAKQRNMTFLNLLFYYPFVEYATDKLLCFFQ